MQGYCDKMQKMGAQTHYDSFDENDFDSPGRWCQKVRYLPKENRFTNQHIVYQLESLLKASDMSVFQITSSRDILLLLTTARKGAIRKPLLTEIDDWMFDMPSYNTASQAYHPNSDVEAVAYDQLKLSDAIICSTNYLKGKLEQLNLGKQIFVIPNSIDFDIWDNLQRPFKDHEANPELIRIGYTGCSNHSGDLELIIEPMNTLLEEFPNLEFISLPFPSTDAIQSPRYRRWGQWVGMSKFPQMVADMEFDIGIAPLRDNELNRAKSNLRWLEYSALKIPTIASKIQPFKDSIEHKKTGIIVGNSQREWYEAMKALIVEKGERTAIGERAYAEVKKHHNMDNVSRSYLSVLKEIKDEFIRATGGNRAKA
jgi:glycosyltransferase involved in cell wall biosynthesis